jgi:ketosteroid isomerase-like protein
MTMSTQAADGNELIALTQEYFRRVDSGAPDLLDLFTEDTQIFFPRFGYAHGKAEIVPFLVGLTAAVASFNHPQDRMIFTQGGSRVVVEGAENGILASGLPFPGNARSAGLFCNVFEFRDHLISRMHVYADPDLAGVQPELFPWG